MLNVVAPVWLVDCEHLPPPPCHVESKESFKISICLLISEAGNNPDISIKSVVLIHTVRLWGWFSGLISTLHNLLSGVTVVRVSTGVSINYKILCPNNDGKSALAEGRNYFSQLFIYQIFTDRAAASLKNVFCCLLLYKLNVWPSLYTRKLF